jgi:hypothetical protein
MEFQIARAVLLFVGAYLAVGFLVAIPFVLRGVGRIDPAAAGARWSFRALILPGVTALWPIILRRWLRAARGGRA